MDYIYCALFGDGTAKFGRSTDVWRRLYALDAEGKRFGRIVRACLVSTVFDSVKVEREILLQAGNILKPVSRESFHSPSVEDAASVFDAARVPYIFCEMSTEAFGPIIGPNSFSTDFSKCGGLGGRKIVKGKSNRIENRINKLIDEYSGAVTRSIIRNKLLNYPEEAVDDVLNDMMSNGSIVKVPHEKSACGFRYDKT